MPVFLQVYFLLILVGRADIRSSTSVRLFCVSSKYNLGLNLFYVTNGSGNCIQSFSTESVLSRKVYLRAHIMYLTDTNMVNVLTF